jgi:hypothetical protein
VIALGPTSGKAIAPSSDMMKLAGWCHSLLLVGCVASSDPTPGAETDTDDDTSEPQPNDQEPEQPTKPVVANGAYRVRSTFDLTVEALLPEAIYEKVQLLDAFSHNPAQTLFDVAEDAGVPAVGEIRDYLPSYVEDKLEGWINGEIAKLTINGKSVTQYAADIAALAQTSLGKFSLDSTLTVNGSSATHALVALDLAPAGLSATVPLTFLPPATATCTTTAGTVTLSTHSFSLEYGEYVWQALDAQLNVRATLGAAVNCPSIASTVANKCYLGFCVGHSAQLTEVCERGLDEIVDRIHDEFTATKLDLVQLDAGTATLSADANTMSNGLWSAQINASQGLRPAPATFTASR